MLLLLKSVLLVLTTLSVHGLLLSSSAHADPPIDEYGVDSGDESFGDVDRSFDIEIEGGNGVIGYMVEYNPNPAQRLFFQKIPDTIIQAGPIRTASTLQFQSLCAIMVLLRPGKVDCQFHELWQIENEIGNIGSGRSRVWKTHKMDDRRFNSIYGKHRFWLFVTATKLPGQSAIAEAMRVEPQYVQLMPLLKDRGMELLADYAPIFKLSEHQKQQFLAYMKPWSLLRQCCGSQQSQAHRKVLLGKKPSSYCPVCDGKDLNAVESSIINMSIFQQMRADNIVQDIHQIDQYLNGKYCEWFNRQVACQHLEFNRQPHKPFC